MGRKIPGRKHRGIKDPEQQAAVRFNKIKHKTNNPPSNPDEQQVSKTLQRIIDLKNKVKNAGSLGNLKTKCKNPSLRASDRFDKKILPSKRLPDKPTPVFERNPGETDRNFVRRMNKICMDITNEFKFEQKYGVQILRNEKGEVEGVAKRPKDELELMLKKIRKEKKEKKMKKKLKKTGAPEETVRKMTKSQKWQQKKKEKKLKQMKTVDRLEVPQDIVKFGEVVHAPPTLTVPKKISKSEETSKPGKRNLLLKSFIENVEKQSKQNENENGFNKTLNKTINKKGKRKQLPHALRRQLEKQQQECIDAYKKLKNKKYVH